MHRCVCEYACTSVCVCVYNYMLCIIICVWVCGGGGRWSAFKLCITPRERPLCMAAPENCLTATNTWEEGMGRGLDTMRSKCLSIKMPVDQKAENSTNISFISFDVARTRDLRFPPPTGLIGT